MRDPAEGIDPDGYLTTGADRSNVGAAFEAALGDAAQRCAARCSPGYGLYVYGSVATGQAVAGRSDLDLVLVVADPADKGRVADIGPALTERYASLFREVSLGTTTVGEVLADTPDGHAARCFLKHYCVCVAGRDLIPELQPCRPTTELALAFAADTPAVLSAVSEALHTPGSTPIDELARRAARKLLLACAAILSIETGGWTTDRRTAVEGLAQRHPDLHNRLQQALRWSDPTSVIGTPTEEVEAFLEELGGWVTGRLDELATGVA